MASNWKELFSSKTTRNAAIIAVTKALHPECHSHADIQRLTGLDRKTVAKTPVLTISPEMVADRDLLVTLHALAQQDKALPAVYLHTRECINCSVESIVNNCDVSKNRVKSLLDELSACGFIPSTYVLSEREKELPVVDGLPPFLAPIYIIKQILKHGSNSKAMLEKQMTDYFDTLDPVAMEKFGWSLKRLDTNLQRFVENMDG